MNVSLTPALEKMVQRKVESGRYKSASEVVRDALRLMEQHEKLRGVQLQQLCQDIGVGLDQMDRGEVKPLDRDAVESIHRRGRKRLRTKRK